MPYTYRHPRPAVTVDCVLFAQEPDGLAVLLIQRKHPPFQGQWALPGGFLDPGESPEEAAARELKEETSLGGIALKQVGCFGRPDRDPREHVIAIAHYAVIDARAHQPVAADDADNVTWFPLKALPALAFDHQEIIEAAKALAFPRGD